MAERWMRACYGEGWASLPPGAFENQVERWLRAVAASSGEDAGEEETRAAEARSRD
jgi:hypothetical protein